MPVFKTIRQTAATGILPEYRLRLMQKAGALPGISAGNRFLVNVDVLAEQLNAESQKTRNEGNAELPGGEADGQIAEN